MDVYMLDFKGQHIVVHFVASCAVALLAIGCTPDAISIVQASMLEDEQPEPVAITVFTDKVELFMEYPRLVPGLEARFLAHVTVLSSGEPVRSGTLRLELLEGTTITRVLETPKPKRDGLFIPEGIFEVPGQYNARIIVTSDQVEETIVLPPIVVHPDLASALEAAQADAVDEPADSVPFLLEQQWKIGMLMEKASLRSLARRLQVPGEIEAPRYAMAVVSAPLSGRLLPPDVGRLPRLGERVEQGQVLAFLEPSLTVSDRAQLTANESSQDAIEMELMVREYDLQAKSLEIEQARLKAQTRMEFASQALARITGLRAKDLGTVAELEAARRDLEIAKQEVAGARSLNESFTRSRSQLDVLKARISQNRGGSNANRGTRHALVAPISGEIVAAQHVEGEQIKNQATIYRLLDLSNVWIATHISEFDLGDVGSAPGALLKLAAYPDRTFDVLGEMNGRVINFGRVVDPQSRTITLRYEVPNPQGLFRAGMFADVFLEIGTAPDVVAIPAEAIVMDNGRPVAFALIHGELFQKRNLELGIRDGSYVEIRSGLQVGERVVTDGAYLVKLASASPSAFGEGHAH